jgi:hypothetical protein
MYEFEAHKVTSLRSEIALAPPLRDGRRCGIAVTLALVIVRGFLLQCADDYATVSHVAHCPNCSKCAYETCGSRKARCDAKQQNSSRSRDRSGMSHAASAISRTCGLQRTRLVSSEPLVANVSSNGAFLGEGSRDRCACLRLAVPAYRLLDSKSSGRTIPTLRPTSSTKSRGLQFCAADTLQSHSVHARLSRSQLRPQKKPYVNVPPLHLHTGDAGH